MSKLFSAGKYFFSIGKIIYKITIPVDTSCIKLYKYNEQLVAIPSNEVLFDITHKTPILPCVVHKRIDDGDIISDKTTMDTYFPQPDEAFINEETFNKYLEKDDSTQQCISNSLDIPRFKPHKSLFDEYRNS